jgi:hypothetical protein
MGFDGLVDDTSDMPKPTLSVALLCVSMFGLDLKVTVLMPIEVVFQHNPLIDFEGRPHLSKMPLETYCV